MSEDDNERRGASPRRMIYRAQAEVSEDIYRLHMARASDSEKVEAVVQKLHASTLLYHRQISRYRDHEAIADLWREPLDVGTEEPLSLRDIKQLRMQERADINKRFDADQNRQVRQKVKRAWTMDAELALVVNDQLDRCAEQLGFAAAPQEDDEGVIAEVV